METRIVRIISKDKRYRLQAYKDVPALREDWNTYITGQHIVPNDPSTHGNLTKEQMIGQKPLTNEQSMRFPFVINPENPILIVHMQSLVLTKNADGTYLMPRDKALYDYFRLQSFIAKSETEYQKNRHFFYIEDELESAHVKTSKRDRIFKAQKLVRESESRDRIKDIALLLTHKLTGFELDIAKTNYDVILDKVLDKCESEPEVVEACFGRGAQEELLVAKLHMHRIITRKGASFFDGEDFVGDGITGVVTFMRSGSNEATLKYNRWIGLLNAKEGGKEYVSPPTSDQERINIENQVREDLAKKLEAYEEFMEKVMNQVKTDNLRALAQELGYPAEEWTPLTDRKEMRSYMLSKYKKVNNIA